MNFVKRAMRKSNITGVTLAPSILTNNRNSVFSNLKDERELNCIKNASFIARCSGCKFFKILFAENNDIVSTLRSVLNDERSPLSEHQRCTNHVMNEKIDKRDVKVYKSRYDLRYAKSNLCSVQRPI